MPSMLFVIVVRGQTIISRLPEAYVRQYFPLSSCGSLIKSVSSCRTNSSFFMSKWITLWQFRPLSVSVLRSLSNCSLHADVTDRVNIPQNTRQYWLGTGLQLCQTGDRRWLIMRLSKRGGGGPGSLRPANFCALALLIFSRVPCIFSLLLPCLLLAPKITNLNLPAPF